MVDHGVADHRVVVGGGLVESPCVPECAGEMVVRVVALCREVVDELPGPVHVVVLRDVVGVLVARVHGRGGDLVSPA